MNIGNMVTWKMSKVIGVMAEDTSDVLVVESILGKYLERNEFTIKQFVGHGCGKLRQKCDSWAETLFKRGCEHVLLVHDLDKNKESALRRLLRDKVPENRFPHSVIIIPVEELEAWLLSDPEAIKLTFSLPKSPKAIADCDAIRSPKDHLRRIVWDLGKKRYLNSIHNQKISENTSLENLRRCNSFAEFDKYVLNNICA